MASKKYSFIAGALCLLASSGFAQTTPTTSGSGYDVADSSVVPSSRMPQQQEFMAGTYNFPAKPRSMWELGIKGGVFTISGDVSTRIFSPGFGIHIRKALGYLFSMRLEYMNATGKGINWNATSGFVNNPAWTSNGYVANGSNRVFNNYKTNVQDLSLQGVFTLNNIRFHKAKTGASIYAFAGIGATTYEAKVNALGASGNYQAQFNGVTGYNVYENRKNVRDQLEGFMDDSYETPAENYGPRRPKLGGKDLIATGHFGAGVAFRLGSRVNLALEDRYTVTTSDLLDGHRWSEQMGGQVLSSGYDNYNFLSLGLNFNIGGKAVEPLWWINPLDYAYQEIRKPRLMILPKPVLPDTDGDGVTDQFDLEVTPQGVPVDAHGVSLDTDGDGVPDARDKEKITPTSCQPVDADGVGKCPVACPDSTCFEKYMLRPSDCATALGSLPSLTFSGNTRTLNNDQRSMLAGVAATLRNNPNCTIQVIDYCTGSKAKQSVGQSRAEAVVNHLVEREGISRDRISILVGQEGGDCGTIDIRGAQQ